MPAEWPFLRQVAYTAMDYAVNTLRMLAFCLVWAKSQLDIQAYFHRPTFEPGSTMLCQFGQFGI